MKHSLPIQALPLAVSDASSPTILVEHGLQYAQQGNWSEAGYFLQLARERLSLVRQPFASELDRYLQVYTSYVQAQQTLHGACNHFVQAEATLQAQLLQLEKFLPLLRNEGGMVTSFPNGLHEQERFPSLEVLHSSQGVSSRTLPQTPAMSVCTAKDCYDLPALSLTCFGCFEVRRFNQVLQLCQNRSGQAILRFLIAQSGYRASRDTLMDILWPDEPPDIALRKLQVAISALRCSLNSGYNCDPGSGYIQCKDRIYQLNPAIVIHTDVDEFLSLWQAGRQHDEQAAIELYEKACYLRCGPFLTEDLYADWSSLQREQLDQIYFTMCHTLSDYYLKVGCYDKAMKWTNVTLKENRCDEEAHRQQMRIYVAQGRRSEALRQYHLCERILDEELSIPPMPETVQLFRVLLAGEELPYEKTN